MTHGRSSFTVRACPPAALLPLVALLAACQATPDVPFVGKKEVASPTTSTTVAPTAAAPIAAAPSPTAAGTLPEPPSAPAPAARTALVGTRTSTDGALLPVMRGQQLVETRADMRRTDSLSRFDNRLISSFAGETRSADIVRLDKKLVWALNPAKKTYTECPLTGCRPPEAPKDKPQQRPSEPSEPSCPLSVKKNDLKATRTGERRNINSFNTERFQINWVLEVADKQGRVTRNTVLLDLWTTPETGVVKDVLAIDQAFARGHATALMAGNQPFARYVPREVTQSMGMLMGQMGLSTNNSPKATASWANEFKKVRGYPILTTLSWSSQGNACADERAATGPSSAAGVAAMMGGLFGGKKSASPDAAGGPLLSFTNEVTSLEVRPVSDSWFAPAADFQKVTP